MNTAKFLIKPGMKKKSLGPKIHIAISQLTTVPLT